MNLIDDFVHEHLGQKSRLRMFLHAYENTSFCPLFLCGTNETALSLQE
jgi:hypothetical protein